MPFHIGNLIKGVDLDVWYMWVWYETKSKEKEEVGG